MFVNPSLLKGKIVTEFPTANNFSSNMQQAREITGSQILQEKVMQDRNMKS